MKTFPRGIAATLLAVALVLSACGDDETSTATTTTTAAETPDPSTTTSAPTTTVAANATTVMLTVTDGVVEGGGRIAIPLGHTVTLVVTSDVDDEVHLHGYDLTADLTAGQPGELIFDATIPGVFEAELHDAGTPLAELEIS